MSRQEMLYPAALNTAQLDCLNALVESSKDVTPDRLRRLSEIHLEEAREAHSRNRIVNVRLASAIDDAIHASLQHWPGLEVEQRRWLSGAVLYFTSCNDDEPDFKSVIGFEDDAEILNACLRFAGLDSLCLRIEDYDEV